MNVESGLPDHIAVQELLRRTCAELFLAHLGGVEACNSDNEQPLVLIDGSGRYSAASLLEGSSCFGQCAGTLQTLARKVESLRAQRKNLRH